jgi:hypothetical protein
VTLFEQIDRGLAALRGRRLTLAQREAQLASFLYVHHHAGWNGWRCPDASGDVDFVAGLLRAAAGARCFDGHWRTMKVRPHGLMAYNSEVTLWVPRRKGAWLPARPRARQRVQISFPCAREGAMPGYLVLVSRVGHPDHRRLARLYLNLKPEGASQWVEWLLHDPTLRRVRFEAKVFNHPLSYGRRDTAMMYFDARDLQKVSSVMKRFVRRHAGWVRDEQVPFTLALARGLSVGVSLEAEEREHISYGELRCRLVARAVLRASRTRWMDALRREFKRAGGDLDNPLTAVRRRPRRGRGGSVARRR